MVCIYNARSRIPATKTIVWYMAMAHLGPFHVPEAPRSVMPVKKEIVSPTKPAEPAEPTAATRLVVSGQEVYREAACGTKVHVF